MPDTAAVNLCVRITHHAVSTLVAAPVLRYTHMCVYVRVCVCACVLLSIDYSILNHIYYYS
jgi:hypothetical protein